jgi:exocyst complex component 2
VRASVLSFRRPVSTHARAEVHAYIYEALLSLVLVHAQISAVARPLVHRTLSALVDELATEALDCFKRIDRFGMGGMLQVCAQGEMIRPSIR